MSTCALFMCRYPQRPKEAISCPRTEAPGSCHLCDVSARNQTWILCNNSKCSALLTADSSLCPAPPQTKLQTWVMFSMKPVEPQQEPQFKMQSGTSILEGQVSEHTLTCLPLEMAPERLRAPSRGASLVHPGPCFLIDCPSPPTCQFSRVFA